MAHSFQYVWRLAPNTWMDDAVFNALAARLERQPDAVDTVALFVAEPTSFGYYPPGQLAEALAVYEKRAAYFRAQGKRVGINVWPTFGEGHTERPPLCPTMPAAFDGMVGYDGTVDRDVACPLSPGFLAHIRTRYMMYAQTHPDFIWVDDDTRFTHLGGAPYPCFCPRCVAGFQGGRWPDRQTLVAALNQPENQALRRAWCDWGAERLAMYCAAVREAVDAVDPSIDLPFMSAGPTHTTFSGDYLRRCLTALRSSCLRPGHGFYCDDKPDELFWKAMEVGRQIAQAPAAVGSFVWEEESHPCVLLHKSIQARLHETLLCLTMGGDGVAFNHLAGEASAGPLAFREYERELDRLHDARPAFQEYLDFAGALPRPGGFRPLDSAYMMAAMDCADGWFREGGFGYSSDAPYAIDKGEAISRFGIPVTPYPETACGTILTGRTLDSQTDEQLIRLLHGNLLLDVEALEALTARGYGAYAGVRPGERHPSTVEIATNHACNGPFAGFVRSALDSARDLVPLDAGVESLAFSRDAYGVEYGCCLSKYTNVWGGRVVVFGYQPWKFLGCPAKLWQLRALAQWMDAPATIRFSEPYAVSRIVPFVRSDGRRAAATLFNASLDPSMPFEVVLRGSMTRARLLYVDSCPTSVATVNHGQNELAVRVPAMAPWSACIVLAEEA